MPTLDLRYALRRILGAPVLSGVAVAVLTLGGVHAFTPGGRAGPRRRGPLMTAVGLISSWLPTRRSSSVDPIQILRAE